MEIENLSFFTLPENPSSKDSIGHIFPVAHSLALFLLKST